MESRSTAGCTQQGKEYLKSTVRHAGSDLNGGGEITYGEKDSNYAVLICIVIPIIPYLILRIPWPSILT